ncbi:hypothetical protein EBT25_16365, partial [bacterium]|nr:hypothetical protein [bacterium]
MSTSDAPTLYKDIAYTMQRLRATAFRGATNAPKVFGNDADVVPPEYMKYLLDNNHETTQLKRGRYRTTNDLYEAGITTSIGATTFDNVYESSYLLYLFLRANFDNLKSGIDNLKMDGTLNT